MLKEEVHLAVWDCSFRMQAGRRVGQLVVAEMDEAARNPYKGKYQGQTGATGSKVFMDADRESK